MSKARQSHDFPALREFLRGYFHQDLTDEYASPQGAVQQFSKDADPTQRKAVAKEWNEFMRKNRTRPLHQINEALQSLGSAWNFDNMKDLESIEALLNSRG